MGFIEVSTKGGGLNRMRAKIKRISDPNLLRGILDKFGREGVAALAAATPVETSETANSWTYDIVIERGSAGIRWRNTHMAEGTPVVILLQYGHGTGTGGYVAGRDFINPAIKPIFERIREEVRKVVMSA